jgi:hypothetical protein
MVSAVRRTRPSEPMKAEKGAQMSLTERLERLAAQHPKLVRALEKEDSSELYVTICCLKIPLRQLALLSRT